MYPRLDMPLLYFSRTGESPYSQELPPNVSKERKESGEQLTQMLHSGLYVQLWGKSVTAERRW